MKKADVKPGKIYLGKIPDEGVTEDDVSTALSLYPDVSFSSILFECLSEADIKPD